MVRYKNLASIAMCLQPFFKIKIMCCSVILYTENVCCINAFPMFKCLFCQIIDEHFVPRPFKVILNRFDRILEVFCKSLLNTSVYKTT